MHMRCDGILCPRSHDTTLRLFGRLDARRLASLSTLPQAWLGTRSYRIRPNRISSSFQGADVKNVAILGGGITGLATAKYLSDAFPAAEVTIFEKKPRVGGWLRSHEVETDDGKVIFETGARSLRPGAPNGTLALRLIESLGLTSSLLVTPRDSAAARNRYIYFPDRLVRLPGPGQSASEVWQALSSPAFEGLANSSMLRSLFTSRPSLPNDESVGDFLSKRIGSQAVNNLASAVLHGIYAGDVWQLSAKSILPGLWEQEKRWSSLARAFWDAAVKKETWGFADDISLQMKLQDGAWSDELLGKIKSASVFTFKRGIQELPDKLEEQLMLRDNVNILKNTDVTDLEAKTVDDTDSIELKFTQSDPSGRTETREDASNFSHVISTVPSNALASTLTDKQESIAPLTADSYLSKVKSVTVAVTNLYFNTPNLVAKSKLPTAPTFTGPLHGFGYLIPNSVPLEQNPERALGVIFDSDISPDLWTSVPPEKRGTRLTVMMGGHWWDGWHDFPSEADRIAMSRMLLDRHLGITERPAAAMSTLQKDCIPQYTVGHEYNMVGIDAGLLSSYAGRVRVAGSSYTGVGVNDCLRSAWDVVESLKTRQVATGLHRFAEGRPMALVRRSQPGVVEVIKVDEAAAGMGFFKKEP